MNADTTIRVPQSIVDALACGQGAYYERLSGVDRNKLAADWVSETRSHDQAALLQRFASLRGAKLLEVGAGMGMNLIVWEKCYGADVAGIEPAAPGFEASFRMARELMRVNGVDPARIVDSTGEKLPYPDNHFDIVYSSNVLEHTDEPRAVLSEALRVLRPGGTLQFVFPNYCSYYDGHYAVFHPPVLWRGFFPWFIRWIWRRDPAFARTLRTELNVGWTRSALSHLARNHRFDVITLGDDIFRERMVSLEFAGWASLGRVRRALEMIGHPRARRALARVIVALRGWTPLIVTLRKLPDGRGMENG